MMPDEMICRDIPDFSVPERVLKSRWMIPIMKLLDEPRRFGFLENSLSGIARGVLSQQLQELLALRLLTQKKYTCFPPCVEYELTPAGRALLSILVKFPAE